MADLPTITWTAGVPDTGQTGTVMTISQILGTGPKTLTDVVSSLTGGTQKTQIVDNTDTNVTFEPSVASGTADSGNPIKIGGKAKAGLSGVTLFSADNRGNAHMALDGAYYTHPHCGLEDIVTGNATNTDGTSTQCIAAQAAGIKTYLTSVILCNTSATAITVDIKDGTTVKVSLPLPAGSGCIFNPPIPVPGSAATAWNFDGSAAAATVTCSMVGFKSKI